MSIKHITTEGRAFIIAEIGQNHDGSLGMCHAYIDAVADSGAHAIKFQTHIAAAESTLDDQFRVKFSWQDDTRYDYWRRMEFTEAQWAELKAHADAREIVFLSTPFSIAAVELLERVGAAAWKIGSGDTHFQEMMAPMLASKKPIIQSTGMSDWAEIDAGVEMLRAAQTPFALLQCTTRYPTQLGDVGLNVLAEMRARYGCRVGLSDHSGTPAASLTAIARGFNLIEVHATFDRRMFGPDVKASLTIEEIAMLAAFARDVDTFDTHPVDKDVMAAELRTQKALFGRSVALVEDRPAGHVLSGDDLIAKKPGDGIPWLEHGDVVGKTLRANIQANRLLARKDLE